MKAAILCNGINWTINKDSIYNTSRKNVHMNGRQRSKFKT